MLDGIKESVGYLFNIEVNVKTAPSRPKRRPQQPARSRRGSRRVSRQPNGPAAVAARAPFVPVKAGPQLTAKGLGEPAVPKALQYSAPTLDSPEPVRKSRTAVKTATATGSGGPSRNAPCPCGSGKEV